MTLSFNIFKNWIRIALWQQILIAFVLGAITGSILQDQAILFKPFGDLFMNALHMMVTPVVFTVIVCAVLSVRDFKKMRHALTKACLIYVVCMLLASIIGITVALLIAPGRSLHTVIASLPTSTTKIVPQQFTLGSTLSNTLPKNPILAFAHENILQIVIFSLILGIAIQRVGITAQPVTQFFNAFLKVVFQIVHIIMQFAPYGIFALTAWSFGKFGVSAIIPLVKLVCAVYLGCLLQFVIVYLIGLKLFGRFSPMLFLKAIFSAITFAFTTSSSAATLPLSIKCAEQNLKIPKDMSRFLLPLGASFNLNGLAIYLSAATIFSANLHNIPLDFTAYITMIFTIVLATMGVAAVPGSALIAMSSVMNSLHIPLNGLGLIAGVDRLNDMIQTATNVTGDIFVLSCVTEKTTLSTHNAAQNRQNISYREEDELLDQENIG